MTDFITPNIHQWCTTIEDVTQRRPVARPWMTQWSVPVDDTHTMNFRLRHVRNDYPGEVDAQQVMEFGQDGERPYEERQRVPGDFDAQSSQRPIAIHALEHLATTDRGVIMMRRLIREGIDATKNGDNPKAVNAGSEGYVPTYANDTIVHEVPQATTAREDLQLLLEIGRKVAQEYVDDPDAIPRRAT